MAAKSAFPLAEVLLGAGVFVAACISILLTRVPGGIALFCLVALSPARS